LHCHAIAYILHIVWSVQLIYIIHCVSKETGTLFVFANILCVVDRSLKNWQYCSKRNLQRNTHVKFYIDAWYF